MLLPKVLAALADPHRLPAAPHPAVVFGPDDSGLSFPQNLLAHPEVAVFGRVVHYAQSREPITKS
jgi:hypothetical protein